jgi:hypothetical protein
MVLQGREMTWYRDLSLSGLSREFADTTLFGIVPKGATDVNARIGIIEQAMTNPGPRDNGRSHAELVSAAQSRGAWIPLITGGVILLDEIGDVEEWIQLKLLRVLNGERVFRVQGEGSENWGFVFQGMGIFATWRNIDKDARLRPDLLQRIGQHRVQVPGLSEYPVDARVKVMTSIMSKFQEQAKEEMSRLELLRGVDRVSSTWMLRVSQASKRELTHDQIGILARQDWSMLGEFRGATSTVNRVLSGHDIGSVIEELRAGMVRHIPPDGESDLARLERYAENNKALSDGWKVDKIAWAKRMLTALSNDEQKVTLLMQRLQINPAKLRKDLANLL